MWIWAAAVMAFMLAVIVLSAYLGTAARQHTGAMPPSGAPTTRL